MLMLWRIRDQKVPPGMGELAELFCTTPPLKQGGMSILPLGLSFGNHFNFSPALVLPASVAICMKDLYICVISLLLKCYIFIVTWCVSMVKPGQILKISFPFICAVHLNQVAS